jgi:hypothetical protein
METHWELEGQRKKEKKFPSPPHLIIVLDTNTITYTDRVKRSLT